MTTPDLSPRVMQTYLIGVYLGVNAIRDVTLLVEGPDCIHMKTQFIQGNQDWLSTLTSVSGYHRVANTALHPVHMTSSREVQLRDFLLRMASHPGVSALMLTSMPMAFVTGADYERLCEEVEEATGTRLVHIRSRSLAGDWLDGYAEVLLSLARGLDLPEGAQDPRKIGIVGHLFDRNEADSRANVAELRRLLGLVGLDVVSVWLDGGPIADLSAVRHAGTILSLPYGRRAAKAIAQRTGAQLVTCDVPLGVEGTSRWLRQIGDALALSDEVETTIASETATLLPWLRPLETLHPPGVAWCYIGDPHLAPRVAEVARSLGGRLELAVITNLKRNARGLARALGEQTELVLNPRQTTLSTLLREARDEGRAGLVVTNGDGRLLDGVPTVDLGFPCYYRHHLQRRPALGFRGALALADDLAAGLCA